MFKSLKNWNDNEAFVIAEIGHNHQGSLELCLKMITAAAESGASAVKLQKRNNLKLFTSEAYEQAYDSPNSFGTTYGAHREFLEFGEFEYSKIISFSRDLGVDFISTAFDVSSVDFLVSCGVSCLKVASSDVDNVPLLSHIVKTGLPIIVSTGGSNFSTVSKIYHLLNEANASFALLQCTSLYPCPEIHGNLNVIRSYLENFSNAEVGFSDHTIGNFASYIAYAMGAKIIEKHFTLDRDMKGSDHAISATPQEMKELIQGLKRVQTLKGHQEAKHSVPGESQALKKMRKSLTASRALPKGHKLTNDDISIKSPGGGISPLEFHGLLGKITKTSLTKDDLFSSDNVSL